MARYKTKPCEIEAIQFTKNNFKEIQKFTNGNAFDFYFNEQLPNNTSCKIHTLEGLMVASEYDYIIKGLRGESYPCKPDVFEKKYEEIK